MAVNFRFLPTFCPNKALVIKYNNSVSLTIFNHSGYRPTSKEKQNLSYYAP